MVASPSSRVHLDPVGDGSSRGRHEILKSSSEPGFGGNGRDEPLSPPKHGS